MLPKQSLALICRFKNERHILYEWIHHHIEEGIDKVVLIDDNSDDDYLLYNDWLKEYINSGYVEIHDSHFNQHEDYNRLLNDLRDYTWLIQIDMDEFIFCPSAKQSLKNMLVQRYNNKDYIRIHWKMFQHHSKYQAKSVIEDNNLTHHETRDPSSPIGIKCIAKTQYLSNVKIHRCEFSKEVEIMQLDSHNPDIQINHYRTQSDEFLYGVKELRGGGVHIEAYKDANLLTKVAKGFSKQDNLLKNKRAELIGKCNSRAQVKPKIYKNSSWLERVDS